MQINKPDFQKLNISSAITFILCWSILICLAGELATVSIGFQISGAVRNNDSINPELVEFPGPDGTTLHGFLYKPAGSGPFPALLWNHGSEKLPGQQAELAQFYTSKGYVFFIPHRSGHGRSADAGEYIKDKIDRCTGAGKNECVIDLHEKANLDVVAAYNWLKQQPYVNSHDIVMSGLSFGGIQTLLTAEKGLGIRAFVSFAPAAMSWAGNPLLHERLLKAAQKAKPPIFLIQATGDYNLGPYEVVGGYLNKKGGSNRAKLYPQFGPTNQDNHAAFGTKTKGIQIWGDDVMRFLQQATTGDK